MAEKSRAYRAGYDSIDALTYVNWYWSMEALVRMPYTFFKPYVPDGQRDYQRGEVVREGIVKWLLQGDGRLDPGRPLMEQSLVKMFRDGHGEYDWFREEYCLEGFRRRYNGVLYVVISDRADDATPPPNDTRNWAEAE